MMIGIGTCGHEYAQKHFSLDVVNSQLDRIYTNLLKA